MAIKPNYRADIDGLRAIAVVSVIFFHADFKIFSGGYLGVDIFFVISGFLITSNILEEIDLKKFQISRFYAKRALRLLPALYFVLLVCIPFSWFWMLPNQLKSFGESLAAVSLFLSNVYFWRTSGYFSSISKEMPLLHTWSLGVEEQYYILFPIFILIFFRFNLKPLFVIYILAVISLILSEWGWRNTSQASFYLMPTRAWEILIGSILAFSVRKRGVRSSNIATILGLLVIIGSIFLFDGTIPSPSIYTLIPISGVCCIILCSGENSLISKILGTKVLVAIGLFSYSAYLWHQPLYAFARLRYLDVPPPSLMLFLGLFSLILGFFTWKYIEQPLRNGKLGIRKKTLFIFFVASFFFIGIGIYTNLQNGFINNKRWDDIRSTQKVFSELSSGFNYCKMNHTVSEFGGFPVCLIGDNKIKPEGILWGDSYAASALFGIDKELKKRKKSFYAVLSDGCVPVSGMERKNRAFHCTDFKYEQFIEKFLKNKKLHNLIWVGRFETVLAPSLFNEYLIDSKKVSAKDVKLRILDMARQLSKSEKNVVFVGDTPRYQVPVAKYISKLFMLELEIDPKKLKAVKQDLRKTFGLDKKFLKQLETYIKVVDGLELFCKQQMCSALDQKGNPLVVDTGHISHLGSSILAKAIFSELYEKK